MNTRAPGVVMSTARATGPHLTVAGELDGPGALRLRAQLDDAITPRVTLTLDLSRVQHVSAEALGVLVHAYRRLRDSGGDLVLTGVSEPVVRVLRISGLHKVFPVVPPPEPLPVAAAQQ